MYLLTNKNSMNVPIKDHLGLCVRGKKGSWKGKLVGQRLPPSLRQK
jgi:hypothetical protein